jgi:hypothetical protein
MGFPATNYIALHLLRQDMLRQGKLAIKPSSMTFVHRTVPESVLDKESHAIRAVQTHRPQAVVGN